MKNQESLGFSDWLSTVAVTIDSDENVRQALRKAGPLKIQFELPVRFFVAGNGDDWAVGLGELYHPKTVFRSDFDAFSLLLQGKFQSDKVQVEGDSNALALLFGALAQMNASGPKP